MAIGSNGSTSCYKSSLNDVCAMKYIITWFCHKLFQASLTAYSYINNPERICCNSKAGVKLLTIVGSKSPLSPQTSLLLFFKTEINNTLNQQCLTIWPEPNRSKGRKLGKSSPLFPSLLTSVFVLEKNFEKFYLTSCLCFESFKNRPVIVFQKTFQICSNSKLGNCFATPCSEQV